MDAVEDTDREKERTGKSFELGNRSQNFHCRSCGQAPRIRETCGSDKI
jgi:hypothetical protein